MSTSWDTYRLYKWESAMVKYHLFPDSLTKRRSMEYLRKFAHRVWSKHGRNGIDKLDIKAWNATYWHTGKEKWRGWSYAMGFKEMRLGRDFRTTQYVLHELTHCIGYFWHGKEFVRKYGELLVEYGGLDEGWVAMSMGMYGIKLLDFKSSDH